MIIWRMTFNSQIEPPCADGASMGVLAVIWLWFQAVSRSVLGRDILRDDSASFYPAWGGSPVNRAQIRLYNHHPNRPLSPARNLVPFYRFGPPVSPTQFLERLCRMSTDGRIDVYRNPYWSSRMTREAFMAMFSRGDFRVPDGLCDVHLGPD